MAKKLGIALACVLLTAVIYAATQGDAGWNLLSTGGAGSGTTAVQSATTAAIAADQPIESLAGELPPHDPTVGKLAGSAGTSGGAASYSIPIALPPGRRGMQPSLSLSYSSRAGNGIAGMGWSLSGLSSLHRCPATIEQDGMIGPVSLTNADKLCLDGQRLIPTSGTYGALGTVYDTELESFVRVTQLGGDLQSASTYFKVETKSGEILWYGNNSTAANVARVVPGNVTVPLSWMLARKEDRLGNFIRYAYTGYGNGEVLLSDVYYTGFGTIDGDRDIHFAYQARPTGATDNDQSSSYLAGGVTMQTQRLTVISTWSGVSNIPGNEVREYRLNYGSATSQSTHRSLLASVTECGFLGGSSACLPPTTFTWQQGPMQTVFHPATLLDPNGLNDLTIIRTLPDYTGDGMRKVLASDPNFHYFIISLNADGTERGVIDATGIVDPNSSTGIQGTDPSADFDGSGKADLVGLDANNNIVIYFWDGPVNATTFAQAFTRQWNTGIPGSPPAVIADAIPRRLAYVGDVNGDGRPDLVQYVEYPNNPDSCRAKLQVYLNVANTANPSQMGSFTPATNAPCIAAQRESYGINGIAYSFTYEDVLKTGDLNGDGLPDFVLSKADQYDYGIGVPGRILYGTRSPTYSLTSAPYTSLFQGGYGTDELSSKAIILWPDINGDGLPDYAIARGTGWAIRMNTGHGLGPLINTGAFNGIERCTSHGATSAPCSSVWQPWHSEKMGIADIDADGRQEILIPRRFAKRMCGRYIDNSNKYEPQLYYACPEDPATDADLSPADYPNLVLGDEVRGMYANGLGFQDPSVYLMNAVRFIETAPNQFQVTEEQTARIQEGGVAESDVFGDGLEDGLTGIGCLFGTSTGQPRCVAASDVDQLNGYTYPSAPPDTGFINENRGPNGQMNPDGKTPELPDLMSMVTDGLGAQTVWTYYPLSSNAGRTSGQTPLYTLPTDPAQRYVDDRHIYFTSSMPVVSDMSSSDGLGGYRVLRYGYSQAMYNQQGRGFQGFRSIIKEDLAAGLRTTTTFNQKFPLA